MRFRRLRLIIVAWVLPAAAVCGEDPSLSANQRGWQELSLANAREAQDAFANAIAAHPTDRDTRLGAALALLQLRSRTPGNIATAGELLEALRAENAHDDAGIGAAYYLARIAQVHSFTPDRDAAVTGYRALLAAHPDHHYAQLAAPKLAILLLYDDVPPAEWEHRVDEIRALIPRLTTPEAVRDTRLALAMAFIRMRNDYARAYPLFASCLDDGFITRLPRLNAVLVLAAESARQLGKSTEAAGFYARFLEKFPQDMKADEIRRRLNQLKPEVHQ
jgi:tetratricopeptide (TPR) repeat protein